MATMRKPEIFRMRPWFTSGMGYPYRGRWVVAYTTDAGMGGSLEHYERYFKTWREAFDWAFNEQCRQVGNHLRRIKKTNCGCGWCKCIDARATTN